MRPQSGRDLRQDLVGFVVLPSPNYAPSLRLKRRFGVKIARDIRAKFGCPPLRVRTWAGPMLRADVPEAAVDEDRDFGAGKSNVDCPTRQFGHRIVDAVAVAGGVEQSADCEFRFVVLALHLAHAPGDSVARRAGVGGDMEGRRHLPIVALRAARIHRTGRARHTNRRHAEELVKLELTF